MNTEKTENALRDTRRGENGTASTESTTSKPKAMNKEDVKKGFAAWDATAKTIADLTSKLEAAKAKASLQVKAIVESAGGKKGPFKHPTTGLALSAVERQSKTGGESTWYFKGPSVSDLIEL
jgi:hypothetical protein